MKSYKQFAFYLLVALVLVGSVSGVVFAGNTTPTQDVYKVKEVQQDVYKVKEAKPVLYDEKNKSQGGVVGLSVNPSGALQFSGARFVSLSGQNVFITVYGLPLTLVTSSSTQVLGVASLANIAVGDTLSGNGTVDPNTGVVSARMIRDESQQTSRIADLERQINTLLEQLRRLQSGM